ncbi:MAG: polyprenyl diphosphate synthase [Oscillospiraceae bacterium]|nr:polyprenyl diphosphate synthase [Oscillospiraceae bacterium]
METRTKGDAHRLIPGHIGIIMDGNRRWARKRGLPYAAGHARGAEVFQRIIRYCEKIGVKAVSVYAFSTENWSRPKEEVDVILNLLRRYLKDAFGFKSDNIKITFIGERSQLGSEISALMEEIEEFSKNNDGLALYVAVNYGGRREILSAAKALAREVSAGQTQIEEVDEEYFEKLMYAPESPPPDMILRPGAEQRISNFLLWQCAYSEFVFTDTLWPDFGPKDLESAIDEFNRRTRRFGSE